MMKGPAWRFLCGGYYATRPDGRAIWARFALRELGRARSARFTRRCRGWQIFDARRHEIAAMPGRGRE